MLLKISFRKIENICHYLVSFILVFHISLMSLHKPNRFFRYSTTQSQEQTCAEFCFQPAFQLVFYFQNIKHSITTHLFSSLKNIREQVSDVHLNSAQERPLYYQLCLHKQTPKFIINLIHGIRCKMPAEKRLFYKTKIPELD